MALVRIVTADFYMSAPLSGLDVMYSEFRGSAIYQLPIIRIFGSLSTGEKACLHIHGVFPYIYIPYDGSDNEATVMYQMAATLDKTINISLGQTNSNAQHVYKIVLVSGIPLYGYHPKEHQFLKIYFYNPLILKKACSLLQNGSILGRVYQPHEAHLPFVLQFMIDYNLHGMSFISLSKVLYRQGPNQSEKDIPADLLLPSTTSKTSTCQIEIDSLADFIENRLEIAYGKLTANPGILALWEDERQRRRNKQQSSQLSSCLTQQRKNNKPTESHILYRKALIERLLSTSKSSNLNNNFLLNNSVYPKEKPNNKEILSASTVISHSPLNSQNVSDNSSLESTITEKDSSHLNSSSTSNIFLDTDAQNLLNVLKELDKEENDLEEDSILSQNAKKLENDEEEDFDFDMSLPLQIDANDNSNEIENIEIPQLDGANDHQDKETDKSVSICTRNTEDFYNIHKSHRKIKKKKYSHNHKRNEKEIILKKFQTDNMQLSSLKGDGSYIKSMVNKLTTKINTNISCSAGPHVKFNIKPSQINPNSIISLHQETEKHNIRKCKVKLNRIKELNNSTKVSKSMRPLKDKRQRNMIEINCKTLTHMNFSKKLSEYLLNNLGDKIDMLLRNYILRKSITKLGMNSRLENSVADEHFLSFVKKGNLISNIITSKLQPTIIYKMKLCNLIINMGNIEPKNQIKLCSQTCLSSTKRKESCFVEDKTKHPIDKINNSNTQQHTIQNLCPNSTFSIDEKKECLNYSFLTVQIDVPLEYGGKKNFTIPVTHKLQNVNETLADMSYLNDYNITKQNMADMSRDSKDIEVCVSDRVENITNFQNLIDLNQANNRNINLIGELDSLFPKAADCSFVTSKNKVNIISHRVLSKNEKFILPYLDFNKESTPDRLTDVEGFQKDLSQCNLENQKAILVDDYENGDIVNYLEMYDHFGNTCTSSHDFEFNSSQTDGCDKKFVQNAAIISQYLDISDKLKDNRNKTIFQETNCADDNLVVNSFTHSYNNSNDNSMISSGLNTSSEMETNCLGKYKSTHHLESTSKIVKTMTGKKRKRVITKMLVSNINYFIRRLDIPETQCILDYVQGRIEKNFVKSLKTLKDSYYGRFLVIPEVKRCKHGFYKVKKKTATIHNPKSIGRISKLNRRLTKLKFTDTKSESKGLSLLENNNKKTEDVLTLKSLDGTFDTSSEDEIEDSPPRSSLPEKKILKSRNSETSKYASLEVFTSPSKTLKKQINSSENNKEIIEMKDLDISLEQTIAEEFLECRYKQHTVFNVTQNGNIIQNYKLKAVKNNPVVDPENRQNEGSQQSTEHPSPSQNIFDGNEFLCQNLCENPTKDEENETNIILQKHSSDVSQNLSTKSSNKLPKEKTISLKSLENTSSDDFQENILEHSEDASICSSQLDERNALSEANHTDLYIEEKTSSQSSTTCNSLNSIISDVNTSPTLENSQIIDTRNCNSSQKTHSIAGSCDFNVLSDEELQSNSGKEKVCSSFPSSSSSSLLTPYQKTFSLTQQSSTSGTDKEFQSHLQKEEICLSLLSSSSSSLLTPYQKALSLTQKLSISEVENENTKKHSLTADGLKVFIPKYNPPSYDMIQSSMCEFNIPLVRHQEPYYSDIANVSTSVEVGHNSLKIPTNKTIDLQEFETNSTESGLEQYRNNIVPTLIGQTKNKCNVKLSFCSYDDCLITPAKLPPSRKEIEKWIKDQISKKEVVLKKKEKTKIIMPNSPGDNNDSFEESLTLTPNSPLDSRMNDFGPNSCSPVNSNESILKEDLKDTPRSHHSEKRRASPYLVRKVKKMRKSSQKNPCRQRLCEKFLSKSSESEDLSEKETSDDTNKANESEIQPQFHNDKNLRKTLLQSQFLNSFISSNNKIIHDSRQITNTTMNNTYGFKTSLENLQKARAVIDHQCITLLLMEIHTKTRGDYKPDPDVDPIRAIFYTIFNDFPGQNQQIQSRIIAVHIPSIVRKTASGTLDIMGFQVSVTYVNTETDLIYTFLDIIKATDPDIFAGYEIEMQSWGYLIERGYRLNINLKSSLSRSFVELKHGDDENEELKLTGRIILDVWRLLRHEIALQSYTFENVMYHILHKRVPQHSFKDLTFWWEHHSSLFWERTASYYFCRVQGVLNILQQLDIIERTSELARLFGIQFYEVLSRGSQYRVESMMLRLAKPLNYIAVSPSVTQRARMNAPEHLPLILEPKSRFYADPVIVLDFQSLYPSIIIAYNYCFSTCLGKIERLGKNTPFEFGATQLRISRNRLKKLVKKDFLNISPCRAAFVKEKVREGILPRMLREILDTRLMVKKSMKENPDDKILQRVLHNRQLGLKLIANVTYGYTAANFSGRMPSVEVGDSVVSKGRETLLRAIKLIENTSKWNAKVIYGDTDSIFVLVAGRSKEEAFKIGTEIADAVTNDNPSPVKLKLEKVFQPCILQTKKRYVGYMFESPNQTEPEFCAKGIETVRRDGCPAVSKMLEKSLRILFDTRDVSLVRQYVVRQFDKLFSGRVSIQDLTFAKEYRGPQGYRPGACVPALELARKWKAIDKRSEPRCKERVPYVIVSGPPGLPLIKLVRSPRELLADPNLHINALYYITHVIIPALNRCFSLIGVDINSWFNEMPRKQTQYLPSNITNNTKKSTISQYFFTTACATCDSQTQNGLCEICLNRPQETIFLLQEKVRIWEKKYWETLWICQSCCRRSEDINCISLDCPILYRLNQTQRDLQQAPFVRSLFDKFENLEF